MFIGIKEASLRLQGTYFKELAKMGGEEYYVDLKVIIGEQMEQIDSDREYHLEIKQFERYSIRIEDILSRSDDFVLVRVLPG